jgi:hypothetical protein
LDEGLVLVCWAVGNNGPSFLYPLYTFAAPGDQHQSQKSDQAIDDQYFDAEFVSIKPIHRI